MVHPIIKQHNIWKEQEKKYKKRKKKKSKGRYATARDIEDMMGY